MKAKLLTLPILLSAVMLLMSSCISDPKVEGDNPTTTQQPTNPTTAGGQAEGGSYATAVQPNTNSPKVQLLLRSPYWVAEFWVNHADNSQNKPNRGRWWNLKPDGTFNYGHWEETLSYGSWVVHNDGAKELIHFDAVDDRYDMEFEMQAVSQLQDYMSWAGTGTYDMKRIAVKATSLLTMPTKAQFGITD